MANYIKIATIGSAPLRLPEDCDVATIADSMIQHWSEKLQQVLLDKPDLIVVPEACDEDELSDFSVEKRESYYKVRGNKVKDLFIQTAAKNKCYIVYSAVREVPDHTRRNSSIIINRKGDIAGIYNKNHVWIEETKAGILCGKDAPLIECDFGRVACAICFDLNFDELRLKYVKAKPDLIIFSSKFHGGLNQALWAYTCRSHFVGAIAGLPSQILNPHGEIIASTSSYKDHVVAEVNLDCGVVHVDYNKEKLERLKKRYGPKVKISVPDYIGSVLISSQDKNTTAGEMIQEFNIETLDEYFSRALAHRHSPGNTEQ